MLRSAFLIHQYSTVQKECKRISSKFGYYSTKNSPKFRKFFGQKFERIFESRTKIRVHPRNFANPRTKFWSDFVSTETKFRIADRKFLWTESSWEGPCISDKEGALSPIIWGRAYRMSTWSDLDWYIILEREFCEKYLTGVSRFRLTRVAQANGHWSFRLIAYLMI